MSAYFPLIQPAFLATVPASFARDWEIFARPRAIGATKEEIEAAREAILAADEQVTVYAAGEDGAPTLAQPLLTGPAGRVGEGEQFGWVKGPDLPIDLWGRPEGSDADWQVLPEGDQAVVVGGVVAEELEGKADVGEDGTVGGPGGSPLSASVVSGSHSPVATPGVPHVINVKDGAFGAKGDGTTNDTASVEAAIAALPTTGGEIFFPIGIYRIENLVVTKFNVRFVGAGNPGDGISGSFTTKSFSGTAWTAKEPGAWIVTCGLPEGSADYRGQGFENLAFYDSSTDHESIEGAMRIRRVNNGRVTNCNFHHIINGYAIKMESFESNPQWWRFDGINTLGVKFGIYDDGATDCFLTNSKILNNSHGEGVQVGSIGLYLYGSAWHVWGTQVQWFEKECVLGSPSESSGHHKLLDFDFESANVLISPSAKVGIEVHSPNNVILSNVGWAQRYSDKPIHIMPGAVGTTIVGFAASPQSELESIKNYVNDEGTATMMLRTPNYSGVWAPMQAAKFGSLAGQPPRETMPVHLATGTLTLASGTLQAGLIPVEPGDLISKLGFVAGSTAASFGTSGYHWWMALYTTAGVLLSQTPDKLNSAIGASVASGLIELETPYKVPQGVHALYAALMVNVGTGGSPAMPTIRGNSSSAVLGGAGLFTGAKNYGATAGTTLGATAPAPATLANAGIFPYFGAA